MKRALIFNAENRIALVLCREFARNGFTVDMASDVFLSRGFYSKFCSKSIRYQLSEIGILYDYIKKTKPNIIVPVVDNSFLAAYELIDRGISGIIPLPPKDLFIIMRNKQSAMQLLKLHDLHVPLTYSINEFVKNKHDLNKLKGNNMFLIKPRIGHSGRGIIIFKSSDNFEYAYNVYSKQRNTINRKFLGCHLENPIIQEYIEGENYSLNMIIYNKRLYLKQLVHHIRSYPADFGCPIRSRTVEIKDAYLDKIIDFFIKIKWDGIVHCDLIRNSEGYYFINEVNPRFWGTIENTILSGIDIVDILLTLRDSHILSVSIPTNYNYEYRQLFGELSNIYKADKKIVALHDLIRKTERKVCYNINAQDILPHLIHLIRLFLFKEAI